MSGQLSVVSGQYSSAPAGFPANDWRLTTDYPSAVTVVARILIGLLLCLTVAGCGFRLRGDVSLPFESVYIAAGGDTPFAADLSLQIEGGGRTRVVARPEDAQALLYIMSANQEKQILTLTGAGTVAEFLLRYRVNFRLQGRDQRELIPLSEIVVVRDYSFNSSQVLAKDKEEALLYRDMQSDAVQQMLRRLQAAKL